MSMIADQRGNRGLEQYCTSSQVHPDMALPSTPAPVSTVLTDERIEKLRIIAAGSMTKNGQEALEHWIKCSREVAAQAGQVAVPEGWKLVPIEPTERMREAAASFGCPDDPSCPNGYVSQRGDEAVASWAYMLAAAPSPAKESK